MIKKKDLHFNTSEDIRLTNKLISKEDLEHQSMNEKYAQIEAISSKTVQAPEIYVPYQKFNDYK